MRAQEAGDTLVEMVRDGRVVFSEGAIRISEVATVDAVCENHLNDEREGFRSGVERLNMILSRLGD